MAASRGKTICFIDNANVYHGQIENGWRIDWEKFTRFLEENGEVWQTYFFASETDPPSDGATAFYQFLKEDLRWEVVLYTLGKKTLRCTPVLFRFTEPETAQPLWLLLFSTTY